MANIKIAELQSSLLEKVSVIDLDAVHGGARGLQFNGTTTGGGIGYASSGTATIISNSYSFLSGDSKSVDIEFGTATQGFTSPK
ncbi:hypothetical protein [Nostoc sp.]|uniref:hypothetical protein n=1 Tax=Nostoc sp. TaxID=1180 RepID=UPI002FFB0513